MDIMRIDAQEITGSIKSTGAFAINLLGLPYGGHIGGKDLHRQFFSKNTDFQMSPGDELPAVYYHGFAERMIDPNTRRIRMDETPEFYGKAALTKFDERGGWFEIIIDEGKKHAARLYKSAMQGNLRGSVGRAGRLSRMDKTGEFKLYVPGELSLIDQVFKRNELRFAANNLAVGMLKSLYNEAGLNLPEGLHEEVRQYGPSKILKVRLADQVRKETNKYLIKLKKE